MNLAALVPEQVGSRHAVHTHLRHRRMPRVATMFAVAIALAAIACGGDGAGQPSANTVSRQEIANALTGFVEALANGDDAALEGFWSSSCADPGRSVQAESVSRLVSGLSDLVGDGEYQLTVNSDTLVIDATAGDHVTVPLDQPQGALAARLGDQVLPDDEVRDLLFVEVPLSFAREEGRWLVVTCTLFVEEGASRLPHAPWSPGRYS